MLGVNRRRGWSPSPGVSPPSPGTDPGGTGATGDSGSRSRVMDTTVRATCPKCRSTLRIPTLWVGQMVRCKKCHAVVRSKPRRDDDTPRPASNGTAEAAPLGQPVPANAFAFTQPPAHDDEP